MIYFLSDSHLGSRVITDPQAHQQKLVNLLQTMGKDASEIFLLGDVFDFWYEYLWERMPEKEVLAEHTLPKGKRPFALLLMCLRDLVQKGVKVHYFIGNHDIWIFGGLTRATGVEVHRKHIVINRFGKEIMLAHGDGLVPKDYVEQLPPAVQRKIRSFMLLRAFFHCSVPQYIFRAMPPKWGDEIGYAWAKNSRQKELDHPCPYKGEKEEELILFAKEQEKQQHIDYYIFGHRHIELDIQITTQSRVLILGDMFKQWTYAAMNEKGEMQLLNIEE